MKEWATWSSWRGSVDIVRRLAEKLSDSVADDAKLKITVAVLEDEEVFESAAEFAENVTQDALGDFYRLTITAEGGGISAQVVFARDKPGAPSRGDPGNVKLTVCWSTASQAKHARDVARTACAVLRRGHREWLGRSAGSSGIPASLRGSSLPRPPGAAVLGRGLAGAGFAWLVLSTIAALLPKHPISSALQTLLCIAASLASVHLLTTLVPTIEIAEKRKTRLAFVLRWGGVTVAGLILAQIAKNVFGS